MATSTITDADFDAFGRAAGSATPRQQRRRRWPWVLLVMAMTLLAALVVSAWLLGSTLDETRRGADIRVDGESILEFGAGQGAAFFAAAALVAAALVLVLVPLAMLLALLLTALVLCAVVLVLLAVFGLALSPLWVIGLLLWLALREPKVADKA